MEIIPERINLASYYLDRNLEEGRGGRTALYYRDRTYSYRELVLLTNRVGNVLKDLGIEPEDRVLLVLNDSPEFVTAWFAIVKIGAVATDAYSFLQIKDYAYFLEYTRSKAVIADPQTAEKIREAGRSSRWLKHILVVGEETPGEGFLSFERLTAGASDVLEPEDTHADDVAMWKFTSGSTGEPKGVPLTHRNSIYNFLNYARRVLCYNEDDITLSVPKLFFGYARDAGLVYAFGAGAAAAIFPERSTEERIFEMIEKYRPTVLINVPTMINKMVAAAKTRKRDVSSLRFSTSAGEALPAELYQRWRETFDVEVLDCIGSAELYHCYLSNRLGHVRPGSVGQVVPGYEAKVLDADGREVPDGESGVLWVKGQSAGLGYWHAYEKARKTFQGEWVDTGDLFRRDADGYFWFVGRGGDVIKVGGIFVAPLEIENCLLTHPAVRECAVTGSPDDQGLLKPKAFIVLEDEAAASEALGRELAEYVKGRLAPYKFPRWVVFIDSLPKDDRGKVRKRELET